jgi:hypothetical protein
MAFNSKPAKSAQVNPAFGVDGSPAAKIGPAGDANLQDIGTKDVIGLDNALIARRRALADRRRSRPGGSPLAPRSGAKSQVRNRILHFGLAAVTGLRQTSYLSCRKSTFPMEYVYHRLSAKGSFIGMFRMTFKFQGALETFDR